jgi:serine/threonine protein kinase
MGIILYELATGYRLFRRSSQPEVLKAITEEEIPLPRTLRPEITPFLENVIMKALDRDPLQRYKTAGDMRDDLNKFLDMVSEQQDIRKGLGTYVAAMFRDERQAVANTLLEGQSIEELEKMSELTSEEEGLAETTLELATRERESGERPVFRETPVPLPPEPQDAGDDLRKELAAMRIGIVLLAVVCLSLLGYLMLA